MGFNSGFKGLIQCLRVRWRRGGYDRKILRSQTMRSASFDFVIVRRNHSQVQFYWDSLLFWKTLPPTTICSLLNNNNNNNNNNSLCGHHVCPNVGNLVTKPKPVGHSLFKKVDMSDLKWTLLRQSELSATLTRMNITLLKAINWIILAYHQRSAKQ
jgi:hypothetical protein